jgi:translation initiation factor IF-1
MANENKIEFDGTITEVYGNGAFKVKFHNNLEIRATVSGKMRQHRIQILRGDTVKVELNQYDMTQGRIVYRY